MKPFTNLPRMLRILFGFLRLSAVVLAAFWFFSLTFSTWLQSRFAGSPGLMVTIGEVLLRTDPPALAVSTGHEKAGSLLVHSLKATLQMDMITNDAALLSAVRRTMFPTAVVFLAFSWVFFGLLSNVCCNIERGEVFSERNLRLMQGIGLILIAYAIVGMLAGIWSVHVMNDFLGQAASLPGPPFMNGLGTLRFEPPAGVISYPTGLVAGLLVLVVAEAFRHGLNLKNESDLTV